jgi:EAL and modified HD-GYP domain-containing signal transduction protein
MQSELVDIYLGRQPIVDRNQSIYGYELLFRSGEANRADFTDSVCATSRVLVNLYAELGFQQIVGRQIAFINFDETLLLRDKQPFFPPQNLVIEILEDVKPTTKLISRLKSLKQQGYRIALDDYIFTPQQKMLEPYVDIVKIDVPTVNQAELMDHVQRIQSYGIQLLAEKVETQAEFDFYQSLGFDYFQGYFFARPQVIQSKTLPTNSLSMLKLLASINDPNINLSSLVKIISHDVSLSQKLLHLISNLCPNTEINSIHGAVMQFGLQRLQGWVSILVLSQVNSKPLELFKMALIRARFCELFAQKLSNPNSNTFFTAGLFSILDAVFDTPMTEIVEKLKFDLQIRNALIHEQGLIGSAIKAIKFLEQGNTPINSTELGLQPINLTEIYLIAIEYAELLINPTP